MYLDEFKQVLKDKQQNHHYRELLPDPHWSNTVDFCSNDYFGLSHDPTLYQNIIRSLQEYLSSPKMGIGATGSRLISGNSSLVVAIEDQCAAFFHAESALLFNSGYTANLALLSTLPQTGDYVFYDEQCHASLQQGLQLSKAHRFSFRHNDLTHLAERLNLKDAGLARNRFIVVEALYSMDGDFSPLEELHQLAKEHDAYLIIDEAHSGGIYGKHGSGLCAEIISRTSDRVAARIFTFGKAFGGSGAVVVGSSILKDYLINFAKPFIYTTAMPMTVLITIRESLNTILKVHKELSTQLKDRIRRFEAAARNYLPERLTPNQSPIQSLVAPGNEKVLKLSRHLRKLGFAVVGMRSPTVKPGTERLRISLHSFNQIDDMNRLLKECASFFEKNHHV